MLKLGLIQMSAREGMAEENCKRIEAFARNYSAEDIDLLCFPELCISGYDFKRAASSDKEAEFFSGLSAKYRIPILAGIHLVEDGKHFDAACIWDEDGSMLGKYRKIHLWDTENDFFEKGDELVTVPFRGWNIGLLICADYGFPEVSTPLAQKKNADIMIYPSAWGAGWGDLFSTCAKMRAAENQVYTVALNRASGDAGYCGYTTVANPDGSILARAETTEEAFIKVILDADKLAEARKKIPWRSMKRFELYKDF